MTTAIHQDDYRVALDAFQGPLDLLLYLIRRAEVDITDIPVAEVTDQYLAFLRGVETIDIEMAGEFLVMAATLIELKSRTLAPAPVDDDEAAGDRPGGKTEAGDPRFELVQQLLAYQRFRIASEELNDRRREFASRYAGRPGKRPAGGLETGRETAEEEDEFSTEALELELEDVHIMDLADAYEGIMASIDFDRLGDHVVEMDDTPIALHQEDLIDRLRRTGDGRLTLQDAFAGCPRVQCVGLFLATLELARVRRVSVRQDDIESEIELVLLSEEEGEDLTAPGAAEPSSSPSSSPSPSAPSSYPPPGAPSSGTPPA